MKDFNLSFDEIKYLTGKVILEGLYKIDFNEFVENFDRNDIIKALYLHIHSLIVSTNITKNMTPEQKAEIIDIIMADLEEKKIINEDEMKEILNFRELAYNISSRHTQELKIYNILLNNEVE